MALLSTVRYFSAIHIVWTQITLFITEFKKAFAGVLKLYWRKIKYIGLSLTPIVLINGTAVYVRLEKSQNFSLHFAVSTREAACLKNEK